MQHQNYLLDPHLSDELIEKSSLIDQRLRDIENLCRQEDAEIDKDFGALFAVFYKLTEEGKQLLKETIRNGSKQIAERISTLSKSFQQMKKTKVNPKEVMPHFSKLTTDGAEEILRSLINKRANKFSDYNANLSSLSLELENCISSRSRYKKKESSRQHYKDIKESFEKNVQSLVGYFKDLLDSPLRETRYHQVTFGAMNQPLKDRETISGVSSARSIVESLLPSKARVKRLERPQTAGSGSDDIVNTSLSSSK